LALKRTQNNQEGTVVIALTTKMETHSGGMPLAAKEIQTASDCIHEDLLGRSLREGTTWLSFAS